MQTLNLFTQSTLYSHKLMWILFFINDGGFFAKQKI